VFRMMMASRKTIEKLFDEPAIERRRRDAAPPASDSASQIANAKSEIVAAPLASAKPESKIPNPKSNTHPFPIRLPTEMKRVRQPLGKKSRLHQNPTPVHVARTSGLLYCRFLTRGLPRHQTSAVGTPLRRRPSFNPQPALHPWARTKALAFMRRGTKYNVPNPKSNPQSRIQTSKPKRNLLNRVS
jgi:hypothetical protein